MGPPRRRPFSRRAFVRSGGVLAAGVGLAGCTNERDAEVITPTARDGGDDDSASNTPASRAVYIPPHVHQRTVAGTTTSNDRAFGLAYSVPDYYWTVDGRTVRQVTPADGDDLQLMVTVWEPDTGFVFPDIDVRAVVEKEGETAAEMQLVPLLNQRWGLHYVANVGLERYGDFAVRLSASSTTVRRTGGFQNGLDEPAQATMNLTFARTDVQSLQTVYSRNSGDAGSFRTADSGVIPVGRQPEPADLPGAVVARGSSGDAAITVSAAPPGASPLGDGSPYLAIGAATPYNRLTLPNMHVRGRLARGRETVYEGELVPTIDAERGFHYGAAVDSIDGGDDLRLSFPTPPQVARYEGYERAFVDMPDLALTL